MRDAAYRDRRSGTRLLRALGGKRRTFTRYRKVVDRRKGSQSWEIDPDVDPVSAYCDFQAAAESRERGVARGDFLLVVEVAPFFAAGVELTPDWRMTMDDGTIREIPGPVEAGKGLFSTLFRTGGEGASGAGG